jgi:hypothetical protein
VSQVPPLSDFRLRQATVDGNRRSDGSVRSQLQHWPENTGFAVILPEYTERDSPVITTESKSFQT